MLKPTALPSLPDVVVSVLALHRSVGFCTTHKVLPGSIFLFYCLLSGVEDRPLITTLMWQVSGTVLISVTRMPGVVTTATDDDDDDDDDLNARCCHYSYHRSRASHPDHNTCFLFTLTECDLENLMSTVTPSHRHWRSGQRTSLSHWCHHLHFVREINLLLHQT